MNRELVLKAENIGKVFPGVRALSNVSFELYSGEVLALLGENGAGKSTFIKVLSGIYQPDEGGLEMNGQPVRFSTPRDAIDAGIAVVHQELNYVPMLTIAENIMMAQHPVNRWKMVDWKTIYEESKKVLQIIGLDIDPHKLIGECSVAEKQQIEIAKAIYWKAKVLILDEPTSALNNSEIEKLMEYLDVVKKSGTTVVYISHKLEEIFRIADRVAILRDGQHVATRMISETDKDELVSLMVGRDITDMYPKEVCQPGEVVMKANALSNSKLKDVSFEIRKGEILGVYGLMGSGHIELGQTLFGAMPTKSGHIEIDGKNVRFKLPNDALKHGLAYVPSERKTEGLVLDNSIQENIVAVHYEKENKKFISPSYEVKTAQKWKDKIRIKAPSIDTAVGTLSGGNQQKVVLAKWLEVNPKVLIMIDPTRGIDVGSKAEIYQLMSDFCKEGLSIIMITSEMPELLAMSDRVIVMCEGRVNGTFSRDELNQVGVVSAAIGGNE